MDASNCSIQHLTTRQPHVRLHAYLQSEEGSAWWLIPNTSSSRSLSAEGQCWLSRRVNIVVRFKAKVLF